jgi:hypothetical protein
MRQGKQTHDHCDAYGNVRPKPMPDFTKDMVNDIIPFVEANYRH